VVGWSSPSASATLEWIACVGVIPLTLHAEMIDLVWDSVRSTAARCDLPGMEE